MIVIESFGCKTYRGPESGKRDVSSFRDIRDEVRVGSPLEYPDKLMSSFDPALDWEREVSILSLAGLALSADNISVREQPRVP